MFDLALITIMIDATLRGATPILLAALGELVTEKAGVLNLGVEGMMLIGAVSGFIIMVHFDNPYLGVGAAMVAGALMASLFALLVLVFMVNQVAAGLALTIFGVGLSAFVGLPYVGQTIHAIGRLSLEPFNHLPIVGPLFNQDPLVYFSWLLLIVVGYFLHKTRPGLVLKAVGEDHEVAHAMGYGVIKIRFWAILFGGALAGLGGAYLSLVFTPLWAEGLTAGRGWIALGLVVFAAWRILPLTLGAYLFGGITVLQLNAQALGINVPSQLMSMLPYVAVIVVLVYISAKKLAFNQAPGALGQIFNWIRG